jgi:ectoine hydroxylase-related dioxygenase (phytanoyl-CoA dioxygenase family)
MQTTPSLRESYDRDGFVLGTRCATAEAVEDVIPHMDAVIAGDYETGVAPHWRRWNPGDDEARLRKLDQPQFCDRTIGRFIDNEAIGNAAAELTGASRVQVWGVQLLYKPPGGGSSGNVGWHQDLQYWLRWWTPDSEIFTCWLALSDVTEEAGAMRFVPGSHTWDVPMTGDFFRQETDLQRGEIEVPEGSAWEEVPAVLAAGSASFHHNLTFHGSGPNTSDGPRRSFAIHLRTENSELADLSDLPADQAAYMSYLDDPAICPVVYGA